MLRGLSMAIAMALAACGDLVVTGTDHEETGLADAGGDDAAGDADASADARDAGQD